MSNRVQPMVLPNGKQIIVSDEYGGQGLPVDARQSVQYYKDIANLAAPYVYCQIIVREDDPEDVEHPKGIYVITALNELGSVVSSGIKTLKEFQNITKQDVGLGNVDNTSDLNKPISTAVQSALNDKQNTISDLEEIRSGAQAGSTAVQSSAIADMATKPQDPTNNNFVSMDENGNLKNSGKSESNFATSEQGTKADNAIPMPSTGSNGYILEKDSNEADGVKWVEKPTGTVMIGATSERNGTAGLVPAPQIADREKILQGDGTWVTKPINGTDGDSAYDIWLDENNLDPSQYSERDFLDSLRATIGDFKFVAYDSTAFPSPQTIGDHASSITGIGIATDVHSDYADTVILMPNDDTTPTATMMIIVEETSTPGTYEFKYVGDLDLDASTFRLKANPINTQDIGIGAVTPAETSFFSTVNLMNPDEAEAGYMNGNTGVVTYTSSQTTNYNVSGFIKVKPNTDYYISPVRTYAWFSIDEQGNPKYISGTDTNQASGQVLTSPANAAFFRVCALKSGSYPIWPTLIVSQSSTVVSYVPYNATMPMSKIGGLESALQAVIPTERIDNSAVTNPKIADGAITPEKISFMRTINLVNPNAASVDKYLRYRSGDYGTLSTDSNYNTTNFIPVEAETQYYISANRSRAWYNSNKECIDGSETSLSSQVLTSPANAAFLRVCALTYNSQDWDKVIVAKSSTAVSYVPYTKGISPEYLEQTPGNETTYGLTKLTDDAYKDNDAAITSRGICDVLNTHGNVTLINGGWNTDSDKAVSCKRIVPIYGLSMFRICTNRPPTQGYNYLYYGMQYNIDKGYTANYRQNPSVRVTGTIPALATGATSKDTFNVTNNPKGLVFSIIEKDDNGNINTSLSVDSFNEYKVWVEFINTDIDSFKESNVLLEDSYVRNLDKLPMLMNACRGKQDIQLAIATDIHATSRGLKDVVKIVENFDTMQCGVCLGDIVGSYYAESGNFIQTFNDIVSASKKPFYTVIGNHDTGYFHPISLGGSHKQMYDSFIKYMVDKGWLSSGEYVANKPYWYHDFSTEKIRLIGINNYDNPMDFDDTYWEAVTYDSSKPLVALSTSYNVDDVVNCGVFTDYSFRCKQSVTTPSTWTTSTDWMKFPSFKLMRGDVIILQEQAQWILDTLYSTPANYTVVILEHEPSGVTTNQGNLKFANNITKTTGAPYMATDVIGESVNAFINKTNFLLNVVMSGNAAYLNNDGVAYQVSKDFTSAQSTAKFGCYLCGHYHIDLIFKDTTHTQQYHIAPVCTKPDAPSNDIRCLVDSGSATNSITVVSVDKSASKVRLVKLDNNVTQDMEYRDMECLVMNE